jgi:hypothetical protein
MRLIPQRQRRSTPQMLPPSPIPNPSSRPSHNPTPHSSPSSIAPKSTNTTTLMITMIPHIGPRLRACISLSSIPSCVRCVRVMGGIESLICASHVCVPLFCDRALPLLTLVVVEGMVDLFVNGAAEGVTHAVDAFCGGGEVVKEFFARVVGHDDDYGW